MNKIRVASKQATLYFYQFSQMGYAVKLQSAVPLKINGPLPNLTAFENATYTASSLYGGVYLPKNLFVSTDIYGWVPGSSETRTSAWDKCELTNVVKIYGIIIQHQHTNDSSRTYKISVSYSLDDIDYKYFMYNEDITFAGGLIIVHYYIGESFKAKYLKFDVEYINTVLTGGTGFKLFFMM